MTPIQDFLEKEKLKMNWLDNLSLSYPKIKSTKGYLGVLKISEAEITLKPALWNKLTAVIILIPPTIIWCSLLIQIFFRKDLILYIISLVFLTFVLFLFIKYSPLNKTYFYNITLTKAGITIRDRTILWKQIDHTYILTKRKGKTWVSYLVIFNKNKTIEKFSLFKFSISDSKLAAAIEYYKTPPEVLL